MVGADRIAVVCGSTVDGRVRGRKREKRLCVRVEMRKLIRSSVCKPSDFSSRVIGLVALQK